MKLDTRTKLFAAFGALLILLAVVGFAGWRAVTTLSAEFESLYHDNLLAASPSRRRPGRPVAASIRLPPIHRFGSRGTSQDCRR